MGDSGHSGEGCPLSGKRQAKTVTMPQVNGIPAEPSVDLYAGNGQWRLILFGRLKFVALQFPFDAHQKIEMHTFRLEPPFQRLARFRAKLHKHFPFEHID